MQEVVEELNVLNFFLKLAKNHVSLLLYQKGKNNLAAPPRCLRDGPARFSGRQEGSPCQRFCSGSRRQCYDGAFERVENGTARFCGKYPTTFLDSRCHAHTTNDACSWWDAWQWPCGAWPRGRWWPPAHCQWCAHPELAELALPCLGFSRKRVAHLGWLSSWICLLEGSLPYVGSNHSASCSMGTHAALEELCLGRHELQHHPLRWWSGQACGTQLAHAFLGAFQEIAAMQCLSACSAHPSKHQPNVDVHEQHAEENALAVGRNLKAHGSVEQTSLPARRRLWFCMHQWECSTSSFSQTCAAGMAKGKQPMRRLSGVLIVYIYYIICIYTMSSNFASCTVRCLCIYVVASTCTEGLLGIFGFRAAYASLPRSFRGIRRTTWKIRRPTAKQWRGVVCYDCFVFIFVFVFCHDCFVFVFVFVFFSSAEFWTVYWSTPPSPPLPSSSLSSFVFFLFLFLSVAFLFIFS